MKKLFKVTCEFYVEAEELSEVEDYLGEEAGEFAEKHLITNETQEKINNDDIYISL